jgi:formate-dependent nitrite reductase membrane component NrfD
MNVFVADPDWGWWIVSYFFLGGIAAGAYFTATLIDLGAGGRGVKLVRLGYTLALLLVLVCGVLLTLDLGKPERFWHMLFKSEVVHQALDAGWPGSAAGWRLMADAPTLKQWSPMSAGSWGLTVFGVCAFLSTLGALWPAGFGTRWLRHGFCARVLQVVGCVAGFFLASYTGTLLSATNQPPSSDTTWVAPLFLASAASTGIAILILLGRSDEAVADLERADRWVLVLELGVFVAFLASLHAWLGPIWDTLQGKLLIAGTLAVAIVLPLILHLLRVAVGRGGHGPSWTVSVAAVLALAGGLLLRYSILHVPAELGQPDHAQAVLQKAGNPSVGTPADGWRISPEDGRAVGGGLGADPRNRRDPGQPDKVTPRSKVPEIDEGK